MFAIGVGGLLVAAIVAAVAEAALRGAGVEGDVPSGFFVAIAALAPVIALGLVVQVIVALAGRLQAGLRELGRFQQAFADDVELGEEASRRQRSVWEGIRYLPDVLLPLIVGLAVQFLVVEAAAIYCLAADAGTRPVAVALGVAVVELLAYLVLFGPLVSVLSRMRTQAAGSSQPAGS